MRQKDREPIPDTVTEIEKNAFYMCRFTDNGLLNLSPNVKNIGAGAFMSTGLTGTVHTSGIEIGENAFMECNVNLVD